MRALRTCHDRGRGWEGSSESAPWKPQAHRPSAGRGMACFRLIGGAVRQRHTSELRVFACCVGALAGSAGPQEAVEGDNGTDGAGAAAAAVGGEEDLKDDYNPEEIAELQAQLDAELADMFSQLQVRAGEGAGGSRQTGRYTAGGGKAGRCSGAA